MSLIEPEDFRHLCLIKYRAGETIFQENDPPGPVYLVAEGEVEVFRERAGKRIRICKIGENAVFGEMSLIDGKPRSASAVALTDTKCYEMSAQDFEDRVQALDPFMRGIVRVLSECLRTSTDAITSCAVPDAP